MGASTRSLQNLHAIVFVRYDMQSRSWRRSIQRSPSRFRADHLRSQVSGMVVTDEDTILVAIDRWRWSLVAVCVGARLAELVSAPVVLVPSYAGKPHLQRHGRVPNEPRRPAKPNRGTGRSIPGV